MTLAEAIRQACEAIVALIATTGAQQAAQAPAWTPAVETITHAVEAPLTAEWAWLELDNGTRIHPDTGHTIAADGTTGCVHAAPCHHAAGGHPEPLDLPTITQQPEPTPPPTWSTP